MARKKQMTLPFSPKKTRSRKVVFMGEVSDDEDVQLSKPPRRSTRAQRSTRTSRDGDEYSDDLDEDSDDYVETSVKGKSKVVKSKVVRGKASRPAYGHFRVVADLDYDSDEDSAALRAHRNVCEKCHRQPTHELLLALSKSNGKKKRRKREDEFEVSSDEDVNSLGGWVRCLKCPVSAHWGCLAKTQRDEILKAAHERDKAEFAQAHPKNGISGDDDGEDNSIVGPAKTSRSRSLSDYGIHLSCLHESTTKVAPEADTSSTNDVEMEDQQPAASPSSEERPNKELLFRCSLCKRLAHYAHLPTPPHVDPLGDYTAADRAEYYQTTTQWQCADCVSYIYTVEHILAWRLFPENAVEPLRAAGELPDYKSALPREYLVKWADRSYRRTQWVPHMWLLATHANKLKNFIAGGSHITLLPEPILDTDANAMVIEESTADLVGEEDTEDADKRSKSASAQPTFSLGPLPDADKRIQPGWKTVDRILDVLLWRPEKRIKARAKKPKNNGRKKIRPGVIDVSADEAEQEEIEQEHEAALDDGDQPSEDLTETVDEYEKRTNRQLSERDIGRVIWGFFKWNGLGYDNAAWDSPPREGTSPYNAFKAAFKKFIASREVACRRLSKKQIEIFDHLPRDRFMQKYAFSKAKPPSLGQSESLSLMPFQIDGVNWLCNNWWNRQHCILADEMGLGKTVQIVSFLGAVIKGFEQIEFKAFPALVVVPNSTITNWVREFERWAPHLRVVPFYGESKAREVIKNYELFHSSHASHVSNIKYHVLVTTYETITSVKDAGPIFKNVPRWEVLVVDEGQRLKSDSSSIFKKLKDLNTVHRIILTGTPLNNNIRELFNLMNFLDPTEWRDLEALAKEHEVLTEDGIKELHTRLRPYFLRRIKSEVLELPPKNEVIVPVSMSALQKEIYRSILTQSTTGSKVNVVAKKANMNNMLMQLRKDIEPSSLAFRDAHEKLISASAKIRMLHMLLPKLKARGHRVLLFSQFKIALDIIEDFLNGEGIKYLRLDGSTKQVDRQRDMDEFNKPNSDVFIYILSTRAGGVGINLWTADTVIIFDPDFNPHQDLQAIARAHRYGQKKTCLVFKFMVKDSAEERIMQTGKKKLVLDHLIVQKMDDDDDTEDVKSILMFGAQTLFEEGGDQSSRDIHYSEHDIDNLIEKTEKEGDSQEPQPGESLQFSFAKVWAAEKDSLEEMPENESQGQEDVWAQTLARIAEESAKVQAKEVTGRGVRRRAAAVFPQIQDLGDTPKKDKEKGKQKGKGKSKASPLESGDEYSIGDLPTDGATSDSGGSVVSEGAALELSQLIVKQHKKKKSRHLDDAAATHLVSNHAEPPDESLRTCGLCGLSHPNTKCYMTESSENLAGYRNILLTHAGDEPLEDRRAAISVIDETLFKRGKLHLVYASNGQSPGTKEDYNKPFTSTSRPGRACSKAPRRINLSKC
ncbi:hypothetical protein EW026_g282 [Hermanssonia centrifuga]|uniref:Chromatin remodeling factor mit1 n=1 Tax=Hermanssonia centrifuga TaxID=98765 RepID=A0A4S4KV67_9APHY|nr:hypothetical protein EW026_g282 [Hermanssonia centrifuga]